MKKTFRFTLLLVTLFFALVITGCGNNSDSKVIKIGNTPFDYEDPVIEVTKRIAEEEGFEVEVIEGDAGFMYLALVEGDIDIWPGVWLPTLHSTYHEQYEGDYEIGGTIYQSALSGLVVPEYAEIDSVDEIKGNEDLFDKKVIGIEPGSGVMQRAERFIEDYDLDLELISGSTASMIAEVDYATSQEETILFLGWRPHAIFMKYDLKGLEDPDGYFNLDYFQWGVNKDFQDKSQSMHNFVNNFHMDVEDMEEFLYEIEKGQDLDDLVTDWMEENNSEINSWLEE